MREHGVDGCAGRFQWEALEQGDEMPVFEFIYKSKCLKMNLIMSNP
jgi:hypothetical protein